MKIYLFIFIIAIMPIIGKGQKQACPEFSPWEKLMKKENYEEANRIARLVYDYKTPDSWEKKDVRIHHDYHDLFNRNKNYLCARYYMAEPYRIMGNLRKAVEIFSNDYRDEYAGDEGFMLHKFIHYCIELGEKELALGNLDLALPPLEWAAKVGPLKIGECTGYPIEQSKITHSYALTELIGDVWLKKEKYETALKYYEAFDTSKFSSQISTKINTAKSSLVIAKTNITEIENQTKLQSQKDETTLPVKFNAANKRTAGLVSTGNISIKINNSNEPLTQKQKVQWEENDLVFSLTGEELYFKNYIDSVYLLWDVKKKVKLSEIPFADIDKTAKGRAVAASFLPLYIYSPPTKGNIEKWISAEMKLSITDQEQFAIKNEKGEQIHHFLLPREVGIYWINKVNIQAYYHVALNKLFIFKLEENKKKEFESSIGVYVYDLNKKQVNSLYKKQTFYPNAAKWRFCNNKLMLNKVDITTDFRVSGIWTYDLAVLKGEELTYDYQVKLKDSYGEMNMAYLGSDFEHRDYFIDYRKKGVKDIYIKYGIDKQLSVVSLYPTSSSGYMNSINVDITGNYFAYYEVFFQPNVGNFVSINLYDVNQPNQIYSLTDQTKYPQLLGKNYITAKENMDYLSAKAIVDFKAETKRKEDIAMAEEEKKRVIADELAKKAMATKQAELAVEQKKLKNRQLYKKEYDSLQLEFTKVKDEIQAIYDKDINWFKQKNYLAILKSRKWDFTLQYKRSVKYSDQYLASEYSFSIKHELEFKDNGSNSFYVICNSTYAVPAVSFDYGNKGDILHNTNKIYLNATYGYVTVNSNDNKFKIEQHTFPIPIKPLPTKPFDDKDAELNDIRAEWILPEELYIRKRSFLLNMDATYHIQLLLLEEDGIHFRKVESITSDYEGKLKNKSYDLAGLIDRLEKR